MKKINYFLDNLKDFPIEKNDFAIFGSGPLYIHGITDSISDIDIIVRPHLWDGLKTLGDIIHKPIGVDVISYGQTIEIAGSWKPGDWDLDSLIENADVIDGLRFVQIKDVLAWKKLYNRNKDKTHIELINRHLQDKKSINEIEVKILEITKDDIIKKLKNLGASKTFDGEIVSEFFEGPNNKYIRLRKTGKKHTITYKKKIPNDQVMHNEEHEVVFDNYIKMVNVLKITGFKKYRSSTKHRISFKLGKIKYDIDKYPDIPWFMEVESTNQDDLVRGVEMLGYTMADTNTMTEMMLKKHYGIG